MLLPPLALLLGLVDPPYLSVNTAGAPVFRHSDDYNCTRIPTVILAGTSLLAIAEGRRFVGDECVPFPGPAPPSKQPAGIMAKGYTDTVAKRSTNGGSSWSPLAVVAKGGWCPTAVYDAQRRRVVVQYSLYTDNSDWQITSSDSGATWSAPVSLDAKLPAGRGSMLNGVGHALQLSLTHPQFPGRLLWIGHRWTPADPVDVDEYCWWSDDG
jgi:sialidase-1